MFGQDPPERNLYSPDLGYTPAKGVSKPLKSAPRKNDSGKIVEKYQIF